MTREKNIAWVLRREAATRHELPVANADPPNTEQGERAF